MSSRYLTLRNFSAVVELDKYLEAICGLGYTKVADLLELRPEDIETLGMDRIEVKRMRQYVAEHRHPAMSKFLDDANLHKYLEAICGLGYTKVADLLELRSEDIETLGMNRIEVKRMCQHLVEHGHPDMSSRYLTLRKFLAVADLDKYFDAISALGCTKIDDLRELGPEDIEELGIKSIELKRMHRHLKKT